MHQEPDRAKKLLKCLLNLLVNNKRLNEKECDKIIDEYNEFINYGNINGIFKPQLLKETKKPLDEFFSLHMSVKDTFAKLWSVCKIILVLSHGQSNVESGFSINKEMVRCNMDESTVITSRIIKDSIHSFGGIKNVPINKALISEYKASHFRYKMDRKNKINEDNETVEKKRKGDELVRLKCEKKVNWTIFSLIINKLID